METCIQYLIVFVFRLGRQTRPIFVRYRPSAGGAGDIISGSGSTVFVGDFTGDITGGLIGDLANTVGGFLAIGEPLMFEPISLWHKVQDTDVAMRELLTWSWFAHRQNMFSIAPVNSSFGMD